MISTKMNLKIGGLEGVHMASVCRLTRPCAESVVPKRQIKDLRSLMVSDNRHSSVVRQATASVPRALFVTEDDVSGGISTD